MAPLAVRLIVHSIFFGITAFYFYLSSQMLRKDEGFIKNFWNQHVYLTNLTHTFITIYYANVLVQDIIALFSGKKSETPQVYSRFTHTYYQLILTMSLIVAVGYWGMMIIDPQLIWGKVDPKIFNAYEAMTYLHGVNHLHLYLEVPLYKQTVYVSKRTKFIIDVIFIFIYMTITSVQYFYFGQIVYGFQAFGPHVFIPIYIIITFLFAGFDFGYYFVATAVGIFDSHSEKNLTAKNAKSIKNDKKSK